MVRSRASRVTAFLDQDVARVRIIGPGDGLRREPQPCQFAAWQPIENKSLSSARLRMHSVSLRGGCEWAAGCLAHLAAAGV